jgi:hypothetical protein
MTGSEVALLALVVASALHLGFQLTVTMVVYPALARVSDEDWHGAHARHGRAITPLVVLTYGALVLTGVWALAAAAGAARGWVVFAVAGAALAMATTAFLAAPTHRRLGAGREERLVARLLQVDRWRAIGALIAFAGAVVALAADAG